MREQQSHHKRQLVILQGNPPQPPGPPHCLALLLPAWSNSRDEEGIKTRGQEAITAAPPLLSNLRVPVPTTGCGW